ncbi:MAG: response regulator [Verrucomicrobiales bacterium]|nr:response regulator [Verrucomicrobiales bacterium]
MTPLSGTTLTSRAGLTPGGSALPNEPPARAASRPPAPGPAPQGSPFSPLTLSPASLIRIALAAGFACLLNLFPLELVGGSSYLLGPFVAWIFVLRLPAIPAIAMAGLPTLVAPAGVDPLMLVTITFAEVVWFVTARDRHRARHPLLVDALFWLLVGSPLTYLFCGVLAQWPAEFTGLEIANRFMNQFSAVAVATYLNRDSHLGQRFWGTRGAPGKLRGLVFDYVFVLAAVPLALVALGFSQLLRVRARDEGHRLVLGTAERVAGELRSFLALHRAAVATAAELVERGATPNDVLNATHRAHPAFVTMLTADGSGRLQRASPQAMEAKLAGLYLGDREYFQGARTHLAPFVSGVFRGRGFGRDVLVAVAAPVQSSQAGFQGIVQGSVLVSRFREYSRQPGGVEVIIADPRARVVHASPEARLDPLQSLKDHPLSTLLDGTPFRTALTYDHAAAGLPARRMIAYATPCADFPFVVIAQLPQLSILEGVKEFYVLMGLIAGGVLVTAAAVTRFAKLQVFTPLEGFTSQVTAQAAAGTVGTIPHNAQVLPTEIGLVFEAFNQLARRLQLSYEELRETNAALDARVADRTHALEIARQQAEAANLSKTDFLAMTSHEIRTPLNAVIGLADSLLESTPKGPAEERLRTIRDSARLLVSVVNDLLDISRVESGQLELRTTAVNPRAVCREIHQLFADRAQASGLDLRLDLPEDRGYWVATDGHRLRQVLVNLVGNALKFTATGSVTLRVDLTPQDAGQLEVRFSVIDTGPGIPPAEQDRLFEPYFRGSSGDTAPGTGLGLAISRRLVELLGGRVRLQSTVGTGSEFTCTFRWPLTQAPAAPAVVTPTPRARDTSTLRILAVDDTPANQEVLRALLESRCANLTVLDLGHEALARLATESFDLALIDLEMPDLDGLSLARMVRARHALAPSLRCRLVAVSAYPRDPMLAQCLAAGFDDYLEKPIERLRLLAALEDAAAFPSVPGTPEDGRILPDSG